jgi:protease-4
MGKNWVRLISFICIISLILGILWLFFFPSNKERALKKRVIPTISKRDKIGVITIAGCISFNNSVGGIRLESILKRLRKLREAKDIKGVLLRINSPGGSPAAAQAIAYELNKWRKEGKKIVAYVTELAASGGYWVAACADRIVALPSSLIGNIGAIMIIPDFSSLFKRFGVKFEVIKSGEFKDTGYWGRPLSKREREILQGLVDEIHSQFFEFIAKRRAKYLSYDKLKELANGQIFTGKMAYKLKLIDKLGNWEDAIELIEDLCKIKGKAELLEEGPWERFFYLMEEKISFLFFAFDLFFTPYYLF